MERGDNFYSAMMVKSEKCTLLVETTLCEDAIGRKVAKSSAWVHNKD